MIRHKTVAIGTSHLDLKGIAEAVDRAYEKIQRQIGREKAGTHVISSNLIQFEKGLILSVVWENKPMYMVKQDISAPGSTPGNPLAKV